MRGAYVMNARDLNMIAHLDDLIEAGVDSLKIEGRNKKAFYVATAVHAYRSVLDGADVSEAAAELDAISHRPYSTGFYYGRAEQSPERDGYVRKFVHAATVERAGARVVVVCHNRFREGDELEVLSPRRPVARVRVRNLAWLPASAPDDPSDATPVPVAVANRSAERYSFEVHAALAPGDYLRARVG